MFIYVCVLSDGGAAPGTVTWVCFSVLCRGSQFSAHRPKTSRLSGDYLGTSQNQKLHFDHNNDTYQTKKVQERFSFL